MHAWCRQARLGACIAPHASMLAARGAVNSASSASAHDGAETRVSETKSPCGPPTWSCLGGSQGTQRLRTSCRSPIRPSSMRFLMACAGA